MIGFCGTADGIQQRSQDFGQLPTMMRLPRHGLKIGIRLFDALNTIGTKNDLSLPRLQTRSQEDRGGVDSNGWSRSGTGTLFHVRWIPTACHTRALY